MSKKENEKKQFSVRFEQDEYKKLNDYRWANHKSINDVVKEAVNEYLKNKEIQAQRKEAANG